MKQEEVLFYTVDGYPIYKGHEMNLWIKLDGQIYPTLWSKEEVNPTDNIFFLKEEAEKLDITECKIGDILQWSINFEIEIKPENIKIEEGSEAIYLGTQDELFVLSDLKSKTNIKITRADARNILKQK